jgi:hypothetical protein
MEGPAGNPITLQDFGAVLAALSALSAASFGLLDATKAVNGGVSNFGVRALRRALDPFDAALSAALGAGQWWPVVRANWIAGVAKADQKMKAQALIKLGLSPATAPAVARASHVDPDALTAAARNLEAGSSLTEADLNVLGRMNATIDVLMDAAFERADQQYRNGCRCLAGLVAIGLALGARFLWQEGDPRPSILVAVAVGVVAVPMAPVAKDLTSALSAAMQALKVTRRG